MTRGEEERGATAQSPSAEASWQRLTKSTLEDNAPALVVVLLIVLGNVWVYLSTGGSEQSNGNRGAQELVLERRQIESK